MPEPSDRDRLITLVEYALQVARKLETRTFDDPRIAPLTPVERLVIHYVDNHPGTTLRDLATQVNLQVSNASSAVRRLTDLGLIERIHDDDDRRRILLSPTKEAERNLARVHAEWSSVMKGLDLDDADLSTAVRVLADVDDWLADERDARSQQ